MLSEVFIVRYRNNFKLYLLYVIRLAPEGWIKKPGRAPPTIAKSSTI
jgi:hypothetical protein